MRIATALDFSQSSDLILSEATKLARATKGQLWLLHVEPPEPDFVGYDVGPQNVRDAVAAEHHRHHAQLQALAQNCREQGIECTALLLQGPTTQALVEKSTELEVDFLVVGSHGHGLKQLLLGSVSNGLLREAHCPVVVVRV